MNQERIGPFIAELRKKKNLTQKELAEQLGVTQTAVSKWEKGVSFPDLFLIEDLSNILGVKISELLNGECFSEPSPINHTEELVSGLPDESGSVSVAQKKEINKLSIVLISLIIILLGIIAALIVI